MDQINTVSSAPRAPPSPLLLSRPPLLQPPPSSLLQRAIWYDDDIQPYMPCVGILGKTARRAALSIRRKQMSVNHADFRKHVYQPPESHGDFIFQFSRVLVCSRWVLLMGSCWLRFIFCSTHTYTHTPQHHVSPFLPSLFSSIRPSTRWCHLWWRCQKMNPRQRRGRIRSSDKWTSIMMVRGGGGVRETVRIGNHLRYGLILLEITWRIN